jgi:hypothetical protein
MADAIEQNAERGFGGAFVVIPPEDGGDPFETLILDSKQNAAQFWILLKSKCEMALTESDQKQRVGQAFLRR